MFDDKRWPMESASFGVNSAPGSRYDGLTLATIRNEQLEFNCHGILIYSGGLKFPPVAAVFSGIAYLRILAGHRRRIRRELEKLKNVRGKIHPSHRNRYRDIKNPYIAGLKYQSLKLVNCAGCGAVLLGESEEFRRTRARIKGLKSLKNYPPPVAIRTDWGPWCAECVHVKKVKT